MPSDADCIGFGAGCGVGFGGTGAGALSAVVGAGGAGVGLAVWRGLPRGIAVSVGTEEAAAAAAGCAWSSVGGFGFETAAARRALGGWSENCRRPDGEVPAAFSCRIRPGNVGGGPRESRTLSFTMTSGPVDRPITMVCAAAGTADAASSAPITLAARQAASRREADANNLPMTQPRFPRRAKRPLTQTSGQNTPPATTPLL